MYCVKCKEKLVSLKWYNKISKKYLEIGKICQLCFEGISITNLRIKLIFLDSELGETNENV